MALARIRFLLVFVVLNFNVHLSGDFVPDCDQRYKLGQDKLNDLEEHAKMPRYGTCWTQALDTLKKGCQRLTDDVQHRMALHFANCFLLTTNRATYPCEKTDEIGKCTDTMTSLAYSTYVTFFTHTHNMCLFLQAQVWQEETANTINKLSDTSANVTQQLQEASELQGTMLKDQNKSLENQNILLSQGHKLEESLTEALYDIKNLTNKQKVLFFELFDLLKSVQSLLIGEFTGMYSYLVYTISIVISYFLTSTPRTSGARFWLFVLMTLNFAFERLLVWWVGITFLGTDSAANQIADIYVQFWWCRKLFALLGGGVLVWTVYNYRDINRINNELLVEIKSDVKRLLKGGAGQDIMKKGDVSEEVGQPR